MSKYLSIIGVVVLLISILIIFLAPSSWLIWLDSLVKFDEWTWRSVSRIAADADSVVQYRMQLVVAVIFIQTTIAAGVFVVLAKLKTGIERQKIHWRSLGVSLLVLVVLYLLLFVFPNSYVGGGLTGLGLTNLLFGVPLLLSVGVISFFLFCVLFHFIFGFFDILILTVRGNNG